MLPPSHWRASGPAASAWSASEEELGDWARALAGRRPAQATRARVVDARAPAATARLTPGLALSLGARSAGAPLSVRDLMRLVARAARVATHAAAPLAALPRAVTPAKAPLPPRPDSPVLTTASALVAPWLRARPGDVSTVALPWVLEYHLEPTSRTPPPHPPTGDGPVVVGVPDYRAIDLFETEAQKVGARGRRGGAGAAVATGAGAAAARGMDLPPLDDDDALLAFLLARRPVPSEASGRAVARAAGDPARGARGARRAARVTRMGALLAAYR
jgi:hypothetical protein